MKRQIDQSRVYKLFRSIVWTISGIALLLAITNYSSYDKNQKFWMNRVDKCIKESKSYGIDGIDSLMTCSVYYEYITEQGQIIFFGFLIGIGLPIVFYVGVALFNYLAPESKKENEQ